MKALLVSYSTPPLLSPESMLVRRMLYATAACDVTWKVVTVAPRFSYGAKDHGDSLALSTLRQAPEVERTFSAELGLAPLYALFPRLRFIPDTRLGWVPFGASRGAQVIERGGVDVLVSWGQPHSSHLIGWKLKNRFPRCPWVAYFGDPWVGNPYIDHVPKICLKWERNVVFGADQIIVNTRGVKRDFAERYGSTVENKISIVPHSYDALWLKKGSADQSRERSSTCTLTYGGNFYGKRTPAPILQGLKSLSPQVRSKLQVQFIGKFPTQYQADAEKLGSSVAILGQKSYDETQKLLRESNMLLLIDAPLAESMFLPSKLVDYLALGKPILALTPKGGASWEALEGLRQVCLIDTDDHDRIRGVLEKLGQGEVSLPKETAPPDVFSPETVGAKWMGVLNAAHAKFQKD